MNMYRTLVALALAVMSLPALAQSETGLLAGVEAEKKLNSRLSLSLEADLRTRNDFKTWDRLGLGIGAVYKVNKWLKADAGYRLLDYNYREQVENYTSSKGNAKIKWRPSYWGVKHRFYASLTGSYKLSNGLKFSLRERWQYNYRPEATPTRYKMKISDQTMALDEGYCREGSGKNQLRSRFQVELDKKRALLTPYASAEFFHSWAIEKVRYTVGTDIRLSKQHALSVYYRFQDMHNVAVDEYNPDMHYLGVGYKFKF